MIQQQPTSYYESKKMVNESTKAKLNYEPFLKDKRCRFKKLFILTDISLNTSMIQPIKLSIPKKTKFSNNIEENTNTNYTKEKESAVTSTSKKDNQIIEYIDEKESTNKNIIQKEIDYYVQDNKKVSEIDNNNRNDNLDIKNILLSKENLFSPIPLGSISIFHMKIEKKNPVSVVSIENPTKEICSISKEIKKRSLIYKISVNGKVITNVTLASHDSFYSTAKINNEEYEISAQILQKQSKEFKIRLFQAFFPKKEGKIVFNGTSSTLLENKNDRIEMGPRLPKMKRGIPVMYFGGRVKKESVQNFILETQNDGCAHFVFGKVDDETYVGEVYPPLSPMQAISIAVSHFK